MQFYLQGANSDQPQSVKNTDIIDEPQASNGGGESRTKETLEWEEALKHWVNR